MDAGPQASRYSIAMIRKFFLLPALLAAALATGILSSAAGERHGERHGEHPGDRDGDHDEDRARAALEAGRILPLSDILERARRDGGGGRLLDVELEHRHGDNGDPGGDS